MSYNSKQFWHCLSRDSIMCHRLSVQSYKSWPRPLQMLVTSPGCHLCFWPTGYKSEVPKTPSSGLINLLEQLTELRETFYLLDHQFIIQGYNSGTARQKIQMGQSMKVCGDSMPYPLLLEPHVFTNPETLQTLSFGGFMEASLHRHGWLNQWSLAVESTSSPSVLPGGWGLGLVTESPSSQIMWLIPLANSPHL